jgi:hypothetical protein
MEVVLVCPRCKTRYIKDYDAWCLATLPGAKGMLCENVPCGTTVLLYHKLLDGGMEGVVRRQSEKKAQEAKIALAPKKTKQVGLE